MSAAIVYGICRTRRTAEPPSGKSPPLGFGDAELGALTRDADVGALQDFGSAGDGCTLDGGDQRLGQPTALEEAFDLGHVDATAREGISRRLGGHVLEVGAGAEVAARTGEDGDTDLGGRCRPDPRRRP